MHAAGGARPIKAHLDVIASCGARVGLADHVPGDAVPLTKTDGPDGRRHLVPLAWVDHVDAHVHLTKDHAERHRAWQTV